MTTRKEDMLFRQMLTDLTMQLWTRCQPKVGHIIEWVYNSKITIVKRAWIGGRERKEEHL